MDFWQGLLLITGIHLLASASPGPDFVLVSQQALRRGRKVGLLTSLGIALGLGVHLSYSVLGLAAVVANSASLLLAIKIIGGSYLIYLGIKGLRARPGNGVAIDKIASDESSEPAGKTVWRGFLCNVLNPKVPVYLVSLFTVVLSPDMPLWQLAAYGVWMMVLLFGWFAVVTYLLSVPALNRKFQKAGHWIDRILGGAMVLLGIRVVAGR